MDRRIFDRLRELELPGDDWAVFGSAPLLVRGIIDTVDDLDVLTRGAAWEYVQTLGPVIADEEFRENIVSIQDDLLTFGTVWGIGDFDENELIDTADVIGGIRFVRLEHVEAYKRIAGRPKDLAHLALIERWRAEG